MLADWHGGYQARDSLQMFSDVAVDERVPGSEGVEPTDEHDDLLGNRTAARGSE